MAGKTEVKAQIKLKFRFVVFLTRTHDTVLVALPRIFGTLLTLFYRDPLGKVYVCVRDFQSAQGRSKLSFSSLDAVLMSTRIDPTTVSFMSKRCVRVYEQANPNLFPSCTGIGWTPGLDHEGL